MKRWMIALLAVGALTLTACSGLGFLPGNPDVGMGVGNFNSATGSVDLSFWANPGGVGGSVTEVVFVVNGVTIRTSGSRFGPGCVPEGTPKVGEQYVCARANPTGTTGLHNATWTQGQLVTTTFGLGAFTTLRVESYTVKGDSQVVRTYTVNHPVVQ